MIKSNNSTNIVRVKKNSNYTTINNTCLRDTRLSWKAKGIMAYFLSLPDDWIINLEEIMTHSKGGEKSFRSGLDELKSFGYVERKQIRDGKKIIGWETIIYELPETVDTTLLAQKVDVGFVHVENEGLLSTNNLLNTNNTNNTSSPSKLDDVDEVLEHYKKLSNIPQFKTMPQKRRSSVNARLKELSGGKDEMIYILNQINDCQFFIDSKSKSWFTFDWIFNPNNFAKIIEGKYFKNDNAVDKKDEIVFEGVF